MFVWKRSKINEKEAGVGPFKKHWQDEDIGSVRILQTIVAAEWIEQCDQIGRFLKFLLTKLGYFS